MGSSGLRLRWRASTRGVQALIPCPQAPARSTSWSARSARPLPELSVLSPSAPTPASPGLRSSGAHPQAPSAPAPSVPVLESPGPHPRASPLCFCQRGSPTPSPLPQCAALGLRRRGAARGNAAGADPGAAAPTPAQLLAGHGDPGSRRLRDPHTAAPPRLREEARPVLGLGGTAPGREVSGCARAVPL